MKAWRLFAAGAVGLSLLAHGIRAQTPSPQAPSGAISGVVIDATTGQPVAGAIVSLVRVKFEYQVVRAHDGATLASGHTVHASLDTTGKPRRLPDRIRAVLPSPA